MVLQRTVSYNLGLVFVVSASSLSVMQIFKVLVVLEVRLPFIFCTDSVR